jgi:hypothetical protein
MQAKMLALGRGIGRSVVPGAISEMGKWYFSSVSLASAACVFARRICFLPINTRRVTANRGVKFSDLARKPLRHWIARIVAGANTCAMMDAANPPKKRGPYKRTA